MNITHHNYKVAVPIEAFEPGEVFDLEGTQYLVVGYTDGFNSEWYQDDEHANHLLVFNLNEDELTWLKTDVGANPPATPLEHELILR